MITAEHLTRSYGATPVVSDVSFACAPGTITGFLGPNGAGKSTTLRMITGLTRPDRGSATVAGTSFARLPNPARVVGTLLDPTAMHSGRSGRATLAITARTAGVPLARVGEALELVGLAGPAAEKRVGQYSLGMRQRLGIAQALLAEPQALILDEPANGLDPEGIAWMRRLLRDFADRGGTVLLSSHLLHEVQATVDHLVVIAGGRVAAAGAMQDLLATSGVVVRAVDAGATATLERALVGTGAQVTRADDGALTVDTATGIDAPTVGRLALQHGIALGELRSSDATGLEELFFSLTTATTASEEAA
ncbi:ABC-2 type transport system ATP-binding protein [Jatrophihabitans endophyticus]|uniref:ABC-2 type transport system ATP-binding protein n=1 Tax=Jatrophihabitans endophyticus TaxID=1206085 RepID=A0A1M5HJE4_9ACTN|nr:ATP-binding cassette domain-containing protein [Jatrophihabitans endophyticus]SHG16021.1 ABC-2 type transport system ATP-binding protein [Jatrophihabitans endophyticus]